MTAVVMPLTGASSTALTWDAIDWRTVEKHVRRLQMRIAKAAREGRWGKVKALQWLLTHSFYAKLLAVRRVVRNPQGEAMPLDLFQAASISITRHVKIRADATPYDPAFTDYFGQRARSRRISPLTWAGMVADA